MAAPSRVVDSEDAFVFVFDRRSSNAPDVKIPTGGLFTFDDFKQRVCEALKLSAKDSFVIATTNREEICDDITWDHIDKGDTLYILKDLSQELCAPAEERVNFLPHYDTIVKGGMYEYYASEGQNPLPYAFAELIDNALAATAENEGPRNIEIRLHFDDSAPQRNCIVVIDNGRGMTPRQLNNWAIYRLSKFIRREKTFKPKGTNPTDVSSSEEEPTSGSSPHIARYMNSDISYFGVGGKQAVFFIGNSTRMISKPRDSCDVHELIISKEEFEKREKNNEAIYSGYIRNRKAGDASHVSAEEEILIRLIGEETERESFTAVVIHNIVAAHIPYLKQEASIWTRQLAHIYHFYLHGPNGNVLTEEVATHAPSFQNIDIKVKLFVRGQSQPKVINLHDIQDDLQTLYARTAASTFEFRAIVDGSSAVEGLLRYHPFLYDRETYPSDAYDLRSEPEPEDDHGYAINEQRARGKRPVFECYWNGRLIPYTLIEDFDWCAVPKKNRNLPLEAYNRISGVLWTNDTFQVSTNKLTFLDLEMRLKDKNTVFSRVVSGHPKVEDRMEHLLLDGITKLQQFNNKEEIYGNRAHLRKPSELWYTLRDIGVKHDDKRTQIDKEFSTWLKECHDKHDKQILFSGFQCVKTRTDLPRQKQYPWSVFTQVEWDGRTYKAGDMVRVLRTTPMLFGTVQCFLLNGDYDGNVFSTGGEMEIAQEPRSLYNDVKIVALSRLDRSVGQATIKHYIEEEEAKLPSHLLVSWPNGMEVVQNEKRLAGKTVGDIKVEIANKKGECISKLPGSAPGAKKLLVELKVIWHAPHGDEVIVSHISQHGKNWPYWFRKMENMKNLGPHTIQLQTVLNESGATAYAGHELPAHKVKFTIVEGEPERFTVGLLDGPFKVAVPFSVPLEFQDKFRNPTKPPSKIKPLLKAEGLEISYDGVAVRGNTLLIKGVIAKGAIPTSSGKNFNLDVSIEGMQDTQSMKIRLMPGPPAMLEVSPEEETTIKNGSPTSFNVQVLDAAGNPTTEPKLILTAKFSGASGLPTYSVNCSNTGSSVLTGDPLCLKKVDDYTMLTATFEVQGQKNIPAVERKVKVVPSGKVCALQVFRKTEAGNLVAVKDEEELTATVSEFIKELSFKLLDEAEREVPVDDKMANKIKVNWVPKFSRDLVLAGQLPDIKVPTSVSDTKYCHISVIDGNGVECSFSVRGLPGPAAKLSCSVEGETHVAVGEVMAGTIVVKLSDTHGNPVTIPATGVNELEVTSEDLVKEKVKVTCKDNTLVVQNIMFNTQRMGVHRITLAYHGLQDVVTAEVLAGPPTSIDMPDWNPEMPVTVYTDNKLPFPVTVQLLDASGNVSHTPDVRVHITKDAKIKLLPPPQPMKTNAEGVADFGILAVSGPTGVFEFQVKATVGRNVLSGPKIRVSIQPDPMKPRELQVDYSKNANFIVGQNLSEFTVKVVAEDDTLLNTTTASHLSMKLWKPDNLKQNTPPAKTLSFTPDAPNKSSAGVFTFRNHCAPTQAGIYNVMFVYFDGKHEVYSSVISVTLKADQPVKITPLETPGVPIVSNTRSAASRSLLRSLVLQLQDKYGNPMDDDYNGELTVTVIGTGSGGEVPMLVGGTRTQTFPMKNGQVHIQNVTIQENSPGKDGMEYILRCSVTSPLLPRNRTIQPFDVYFLFYNDAKKQTQMAALSKERESLQTTIQAYKTMFQTQRSLIDELRVSVHEAAKEEQDLRAELRKQNIPGAQLQVMESVEKLIAARVKERDQLLNAPRRVCGLQPAPDEPSVLGKIAHLALIENSDIARVISWHMSADMDCVVTYTTKKAQEIYSKTQGRQQVLPLDSIFRKNLPDWEKPLPHVRYRPSWKPPGQPMYARDLLQFPAEQESCRLVFGMLLGDTLILDNLEHANAYRQEIIKHSHCPTILTWQGDRIRSNGKFGGTMNKAVPVEKLRGAIFGQPLPMAYHALCTQIESLERYKSALGRHVQAQDELQEIISAQKQPEMVAKYKECQEAESQLLEIERQLGVGLPSRTRSHGNSSTHDGNGPTPAKRSRASSTSNTQSPITAIQSPLNGSVGEATDLDLINTPTRTSLRIASMTTVVSDDGRKRLRKT